MKKIFFTGLVTLLPVAVTVFVVNFCVNLLTGPFMGIVTPFLSSLPIGSERAIRTISQIMILISLFLFTFSVGLAAHRFFFKTLMDFGDRIVSRLPLVNKVYKTIREIFQTLLTPETTSLKQVVMVPFPRRGSFALGLIAREAPHACREALQSDLVSIFIPATPNPMTGVMIMRPKSELIYLDMKSEDALKYVVSCGVVPPEAKTEAEE